MDGPQQYDASPTTALDGSLAQNYTYHLSQTTTKQHVVVVGYGTYYTKNGPRKPLFWVLLRIFDRGTRSSRTREKFRSILG